MTAKRPAENSRLRLGFHLRQGYGATSRRAEEGIRDNKTTGPGRR
jgi:hypothetical protein